MGFLSETRAALGESLAAALPDVEWSATPSGLSGLPAVIVEPAQIWLDQRSEGGGPTRNSPLGVRLLVCVGWADPEAAVAVLEDLVERVLDALPADWAFAFAEWSGPVAAGEVGYLAAALHVSKKISL
jgi:hypothetical protein